MEIGDGLMLIGLMGWGRSVLMEIGVDGVLVMGWWRRGKKKILEKKKKKKKKKEEEEEGEADIEIRMVWRRGYLEEKEGSWWSVCDGLTEKRKEKDSQKKKKKTEKKVEKKEGRR